MRRIKRFAIWLLAVVALALLLARATRPVLNEPPAAELLPELPDYRQIEGRTITAYIGALGEGAALLAGQPHLAVTIGVLDQVIGCYQEIGGVRARVYSHAERPLEAGFVAIADEARLNDPENLFRCVTPAALSLEGMGEERIEPCTGAYTLIREGETFHVIYAGSTGMTCREICSALPGCLIHEATAPSHVSLPRHA